MEAMEKAAQQNPNKSIQIMKVLEDSDTVMTLSHVQQNPNDRGAAVVHIFRFEGTINENGIF